METNEPVPNVCQHRWLLGQPQDGSIRGVCRNCGSAKLYPATIDEFDRGDEALDRQFKAKEAVATAVGGARLSSASLLSESES